MKSIPQYRKALVTTDFSDFGNAAIPHAFALLGSGGGTVVLCHVLEPVQLPSPLYAHYSSGKAMTSLERDALRRGLEEKLEALAVRYLPRGKFKVVCRVAEARGSVHEAVLKVGAAEKVDAVVIASHGHSGINRLFLGSTAERVLRASKVPVLVVRSG